MSERDLSHNLEQYEDFDEDDSVNYADIIAASRLTRDLKKSAALLHRNQVRYLVDTYYNMQRQRIRADAQVRSAEDEPNDIINFMFDMYSKLEDDMKAALGKYADSTIPGKWAMSVMGIGPVITAGLLSHIDVTIAKTSGDVWRYGGYDASIIWYGTEKARALVKNHVGSASKINYDELQLICQETNRKIENWERPIVDRKTGEIKYLIDPETKMAKSTDIIAMLAKRPWNASLKRLGFLIGQSFVKSSNRPGTDYGNLYKERKLREQAMNEAKAYADQAAFALQTKNFGADTDARRFYEMGMLPPAHIQRRVERWVVKIFLSHYFQVAYEAQYRKEMPKPWILESQPQIHTHYIPVPKWPIEGFERDFVRTYS